MKLRNSFSPETRELFFDARYNCFLCGRNDTELHHIVGRSSNSPLNTSVLCKECHSKIGHGKEEEQTIFEKTLVFLLSRGYNLTENDYSFLKENNHLKEVVFNLHKKYV